MFLHVCVILFTGGSPGRENPRRQGEPSQAGRTSWAGRTPPPPPGRENPTPLGRENTLQAGRTPPITPPNPSPPDQGEPRLGSRLQNTVYEWVARILLECILVPIIFTLNRISPVCKLTVCLTLKCNWETLPLKPWPHRASASAASGLTLGQCLRLDMILMLGVGCIGVNKCGPLQASTLMLTLIFGVVRP